MKVVASLSQGRTAAAYCGLFTHKSVPVIFEPPCILFFTSLCGYTQEELSLEAAGRKTLLLSGTRPLATPQLQGC